MKDADIGKSLLALMGNDLHWIPIFYKEYMGYTNGTEFLRKMKEIDCDVFLGEVKDMDIYISQALDKPTMMNHFYVPMTIAPWNYNYISQHNTQFTSYGSFVAPSGPITELSIQHAYTKFIEILFIRALCAGIKLYLADESKVAPEARGDHETLLYRQRVYTTYGYGTDGFIDRTQMTP